MHAIEAEHLRRTFQRRGWLRRRGPEIVAVDDVTFAVEAGTLYALLGHNGAGKTTTINMLSTLLIPTSGRARVAGFAVARTVREGRGLLGGVWGGDRGLYGKISARDNLLYFGRLYGLSRERLLRRVEELLELVGLADRADDRVEGFSRGMKQRLHLAKALLHDPPVIFLDEPTIGLDPAAAVSLRRAIKALAPEHTVLLTTHYLHEADELCDRIAIIDHGRIVLEDTPSGIKRRVDTDQRLRRRVSGLPAATLAAMLESCPAVWSVALPASRDGEAEPVLPCHARARAIDEVVGRVHRQGGRIEVIEALEPTLEDAFLALTNGAVACV